MTSEKETRNEGRNKKLNMNKKKERKETRRKMKEGNEGKEH